MMVLPELNYAGIKIVSRSDFRFGTTSRRITSKEISLNIGTWNVRTLRQAERLENFTLEMHKCELNVIGLSEVRWSGKYKIVSGNHTMFYSGRAKTEKALR